MNNYKYELGVYAQELASKLGGVEEEQLSEIKATLIEAYNAGKDGIEMI